MMGKHIGAGTLSECMPLGAVPSKEHNEVVVSTPSSHHENGTKVPAPEDKSGAATLVADRSTTKVVPPGYKQTKVGVIPEDWEVVKLGDIGEVVSGLTYSPKNIDKKGVLVLRSSNIQDRKLSFEDNVYVNVDTLKFNPVQENDILICVRNGSKSLIGKNALIDKKNEGVAFGAFMSIFRSKHNIFMFQLFDTSIYKREVYRNLGATINSINGSDLKKFKIPFPPLKEQQKIAQILTTWDDAISKQEALIEAKEQRKKGLMQKLLSGEVRFAGFDGEWEEVRLGDIASRITTKNTDSSVDMIFSNFALNGIVIQNEFFDKDIANRDNLTGYYIVQSGDFVYNPRISKYAPSGPISRNNHDFEGIVSPLYTVFRINETEVIDYFEYFFSSTLWFRYMKAIANYGARHDRMNITNKDFMKMPIPYPSKQEQQKIAQVLTTADKEIAFLKEELETLKEQKRGLMQRLLTGEVRVEIDGGEKK